MAQLSVEQLKKLTNPLANQTGSVTFKCPQCGKYDIIRSKRDREVVIKYKCPECGFQGPN